MVQTANPVITHNLNSLGSRLKRSTQAATPSLRFLVRFVPTGMPSESFLGAVKALARSVGVEARNPKWTSYGALELDIFSPTAADFEVFLAAAKPVVRTEFVTDLNRAPEYLTDDETLTRAKDLFNAERYWECHEVLEGLWRQKHGEEKRLLQGLILLCAAYVHSQKGEEKVALGVLGRAAKQLEYPSPNYGEFNVFSLRGRVKEMIDDGRLKILQV